MCHGEGLCLTQQKVLSAAPKTWHTQINTYFKMQEPVSAKCDEVRSSNHTLLRSCSWPMDKWPLFFTGLHGGVEKVQGAKIRCE